jgi:hypothetical protein
VSSMNTPSKSVLHCPSLVRRRKPNRTQAASAVVVLIRSYEGNRHCLLHAMEVVMSIVHPCP